MKWNVFDDQGNYLGTIHAADADTAVQEFRKQFNEPTAAKAEERDESGRP